MGFIERLEQEIEQYENKTHKTYHEFYLGMHTGDKSVKEALDRLGVTAKDAHYTFDLIKSIKDYKEKKAFGEFYTPKILSQQCFKKITECYNYYNTIFWDASAGRGNLELGWGLNPKYLFLSTIQETDVEYLKVIPEFKGATIFVNDFLKGLDYDKENSEFLDTLPVELQTVIKNNMPCMIIMNPPYGVQTGDLTDISLAAPCQRRGMVYQFLYRLYELVRVHEWTNCRIALIVPYSTWSRDYIQAFWTKTFYRVYGSVFSSNFFNAISKAVSFDTSFSIWEVGSGVENPWEYWENVAGEINIFEGPTSVGKSMLDWVAEKDCGNYKILMPQIINSKKFKTDVDGELYSIPVTSGVLGCYQRRGNMARRGTARLISRVGLSDASAGFHEVNFDRVVVYHTYKEVVKARYVQREIEAPKRWGTPATDEWVSNAIVGFVFALTNLMQSYRDISFLGDTNNYTNTLYPIDGAWVESHVLNSEILRDYNENQFRVNIDGKLVRSNQFILDRIEKAKPYFWKETEVLYDYCIDLLKKCYSRRTCGAWDMSLKECRNLGYVTPAEEAVYFDYLRELRKVLRKKLCVLGYDLDLI